MSLDTRKRFFGVIIVIYGTYEPNKFLYDVFLFDQATQTQEMEFKMG